MFGSIPMPMLLALFFAALLFVFAVRPGPR
jgi:hypothetical protein